MSSLPPSRALAPTRAYVPESVTYPGKHTFIMWPTIRPNVAPEKPPLQCYTYVAIVWTQSIVDGNTVQTCQQCGHEQPSRTKRARSDSRHEKVRNEEEKQGPRIKGGVVGAVDFLVVVQLLHRDVARGEVQRSHLKMFNAIIVWVYV